VNNIKISEKDILNCLQIFVIASVSSLGLSENGAGDGEEVGEILHS